MDHRSVLNGENCETKKAQKIESRNCNTHGIGESPADPTKIQTCSDAHKSAHERRLSAEVNDVVDDKVTTSLTGRRIDQSHKGNTTTYDQHVVTNGATLPSIVQDEGDITPPRTTTIDSENVD